MPSSWLLDKSTSFRKLCQSVGLDDRLEKAVMRLGHRHPTLVQSQCLPLALKDCRDLLVRAKTGSGKTLAFCLPLLHKLLTSLSSSTENTNDAINEKNDVVGEGESDGGVQGLILVPTKELCVQVFKVLESLCYYIDPDQVRLAMLTKTSTRKTKKDSAAIQEHVQQQAMLRDRPNVVVATPSGVLDKISFLKYDLASVQTLVIDEADLVLSFGYSDEVSEIVKHLPKIYQGFLMSATLSPEIQALKRVVLHSPAVVKLEMDSSTNDDNDETEFNLMQYFLPLNQEGDKFLVLYCFLKLGLLRGKGLIFVNTTDAAYRLKLLLEQFHIRSAVLNAEVPFTSRINMMEHFNVGNFDYLIATDESAAAASAANQESSSTKKRSSRDAEFGVARGLDFRMVSFVLNYDFCPSIESYIHRIGRTARGGAKGVAITFINQKSDAECNLLEEIQKTQPSIPLHRANNSNNQNKSQFQPAPQDVDPNDNDDHQDDMLPQPSLLEFDLKEIEGFRYRVEDVSRAVTPKVIREARAAELRAEMINSERLQSHFEENPADLQLLRHDASAAASAASARLRVKEHLKHVPEYMLPRGMQALGDLHRKRKRKKIRKMDATQRRKDNDPLQAYEQTTGHGDANDMNHDAEFEEFFQDDDGPKKKQKTTLEESEIFTSSTDGTGKSTSNRRKWQERHKKGRFSTKRRKSDRKRRTVGI